MISRYIVFSFSIVVEYMTAHDGVETKREAERKGGVSKMSKKTQARRKYFCARMCKAGTEKSRNDSNSKQRAALRVWKCKC